MLDQKRNERPRYSGRCNHRLCAKIKDPLPTPAWGDREVVLMLMVVPLAILKLKYDATCLDRASTVDHATMTNASSLDSLVVRHHPSPFSRLRFDFDKSSTSPSRDTVRRDSRLRSAGDLCSGGTKVVRRLNVEVRESTSGALRMYDRRGNH